MAQQETEHLGRIVTSRMLSAIGPVVHRDCAPTAGQPLFYRNLCFMAGV